MTIPYAERVRIAAHIGAFQLLVLGTALDRMLVFPNRVCLEAAIPEYRRWKAEHLDEDTPGLDVAEALVDRLVSEGLLHERTPPRYIIRDRRRHR